MPPRSGSSATGETMLIGGRFIVRQRNQAELQQVGLFLLGSYPKSVKSFLKQKVCIALVTSIWIRKKDLTIKKSVFCSFLGICICTFSELLLVDDFSDILHYEAFLWQEHFGPQT